MSTETLSKTRSKTALPPQYRVMLLNDDYTPMDFVLYILKRYFGKSDSEATKVMLEAHEKGVSTAGIYSFEIAETKVSQVLREARQENYPLRCTLEPE